MDKGTGKGVTHTGNQVPLSREWLTLVTIVHEHRFITLYLNGRVEDMMPCPYDPLCIPQHHLWICVGICGKKNPFRSVGLRRTWSLNDQEHEEQCQHL